MQNFRSQFILNQMFIEIWPKFTQKKSFSFLSFMTSPSSKRFKSYLDIFKTAETEFVSKEFVNKKF